MNFGNGGNLDRGRDFFFSKSKPTPLSNLWTGKKKKMKTVTVLV